MVWVYFVSPNPEKINQPIQPKFYPSLFTVYIGKGRASGVQLENHVYGIADGIAQTDVVSPDTISIIACP